MDGSNRTEATIVPRAGRRRVALMNQKGGVGKTTTTVNLGAALAEYGRRVLLVDLDPQAHLTLHLGVEPDDDAPTMYDLLIDAETSPEDVITPVFDRLHVIPAETDLAAAEIELVARPGREHLLVNRLAPIWEDYDTILFDCPPSLGVLTLNALAAADEVLIPMQAHFLPLQGVGKLLETVGLVCQSVNPNLRVTGIVLCAFESQTTLASEIVNDLNNFFEHSRSEPVAWRDCRILEPAVRRNIKLAEAPSFGQTIFDYAPWCAGANDYRRLAENVIHMWDGSPPVYKALERVHASAPEETPSAPSAEFEPKPVPAIDREPAPEITIEPGVQRDPGPDESLDPELDALREEIESLDRMIHGS